MNTKKFFSFFLFLVSTLLLPAWMAKADITYNPLYLIIYAPNGNGFSAMTITNPTDAPVRMQTEILEFDYTEDNQVNILSSTAEEKRISDYIKVSPKQFTLGPQEKKIIRIATKIPATFKDKTEYKLLLSMIEIGADRKELKLEGAKDKNASYSLVINKALNAGTYVRIGNPKDFASELEYTNVKLQRLSNGESDSLQSMQLDLDYLNKGNKQSRKNIGFQFFKDGLLVYELANASGFTAFANEQKPRHLSSQINIPAKKLENGVNYKVNIIFRDDSLEARTKQAEADYVMKDLVLN